MRMITGRVIPATAAVLFAVACGSTAPTSPSAAAGAAVSSTPGASADARSGDRCVVDVGTTQHPLRAVHELEDYLNAAIAASSDVNCGLARLLDAKLETLAMYWTKPRQPTILHAECPAHSPTNRSSGTTWER